VVTFVVIGGLKPQGTGLAVDEKQNIKVDKINSDLQPKQNSRPASATPDPQGAATEDHRGVLARHPADRRAV
jgi:hypothetical protein